MTEEIKKEVEQIEMQVGDLTSESWREYDFDNRIYRIELPQKIYFRKGSTTHKVLDLDGVVHCMPAVGVDGCVLRWKPKDLNDPVQF